MPLRDFAGGVRVARSSLGASSPERYRAVPLLDDGEGLETEPRSLLALIERGEETLALAPRLVEELLEQAA